MKDIVYPQYLGFTFCNTSAFVMAPNSTELLQLGVLGELVFGGEQVALGYINMPSLTRDRFVNHPRFGRLYRSGDLGRMLPDGSILISGRLDGQVKLRGQRIELGEIDSLVMKTGLVKTASTVLVKVKQGGEQLATFVVPWQGSGNEYNEYKSKLTWRLTERLPEYMVPSYFIELSSLPSTSSGKVDRPGLISEFHQLSPAALAKFAILQEDQNCQDDQEWTILEKDISGVARSVLKIGSEDIRKWAPLTTLGLDSISAIAFARELSSLLKKSVAISTILQNKSVGQLATVLGASIHDATISVGTPPQCSVFDIFHSDFITETNRQFSEAKKTIEMILPCTPLQEALLTSSDLNHMLLSLGIPVSVMMAHWNTARKRHAILRTCFKVTQSPDYPIAQVILSEKAFIWKNYHSTNKLSLQDCLLRHEQAVASPLNSTEPPISLAIIHHKENLFISFVCHHALYDGVAMGSLLKEIEALAYEEELPRPISVVPFLELALANTNESKDFWRFHFEDFLPSVLPRSNSFQDKTSEMAVYTATLPISLKKISKKLRKQGITLLSACQTSWAVTLAALMQKGDICFGNVVNGRSAAVEGIEQLIFPCFNTIPIRVNLDRQDMKQYASVLEFFQKMNLSMIEHQFMPLRKVQALVQKTGNNHKTLDGRLFDTLLLLQQESPKLDPKIWELKMDKGSMNVPVVCEIVPFSEKNELRIQLHHSVAILSHDAAHVVFDSFSKVMQTAIDFPHSRILSSDLPENLAKSLRNPMLKHQIFKLNDGDSQDIGHRNHENWSEVEERIRTVVSSAAHCERSQVEKKTTIYQLGLDSISAVQIATTLRKIHGLNVTATDVIENPTCVDLAAKLANITSKQNRISEKKEPQDVLAFLPSGILNTLVTSNSIEACLPCTSLQAALLTSFHNSNGLMYLNRMSFRLTSIGNLRNISAEEILKAWNYLSGYQPILRTGFSHLDHAKYPYAMLVYRPGAICIPVKHIDCKIFDVSSWMDQVRERVKRQMELPAWEVVIVEDSTNQVQMEQTRITMHLAMHHALYDAYTLDILLKTLTGNLIPGLISFDESEVIGASQIPKLEDAQQKLSFEKLALAQLLDSENDLSEAENFFKSIGPANPTHFPIITPVVEVTPKTLSVSTDIPNAQRLRMAAKQQGVTLQAVLQVAWARILAEYLGHSGRSKDDEDELIVFGTVLSGRTTELLTDTTLPCINTLPVVAKSCLGKKKNADAVRDMMSFNSQLHQHQHLPLSQVQNWLSADGASTGEGSLFNTVVAYQKVSNNFFLPLKNESRGGINKFNDIFIPESEHAETEYAVSLELIPQDTDCVDQEESSRLRMQITVSTCVVPLEGANIMLSQVCAVFAHLLLRPAENASDLYAFHIANQTSNILISKNKILNATREKNDAVIGHEDITAAADTIFSVSPPKRLLLKPSTELPISLHFLHQFLETSALSHPEKLALIFIPDIEDQHSQFSLLDRGPEFPPNSQSYTYAQLDHLGNRVANMLILEGINTGDIVAICFNKCSAAYMSVLGILKAGAAFVALDPDSPAQRKQFIIQDSGATVLLTSKDLYWELTEELLPSAQRKATVNISSRDKLTIIPVTEVSLKENYQAEKPILKRPINEDQDASYCLYTSGTTGNPKGCILTHRNAVQALLAFADIFASRTSASSKCLQFASFHFDVSVLEQFFSYYAQMPLFSVPRDVVLSNPSATINGLGITHIDLTPSLAQTITPKDVPSLRNGIFITGGEKLRHSILEEWGDEGVIYNAYGPTETTIGVSIYPGVPKNGRTGNIGCVFDNVGAFVLKSANEKYHTDETDRLIPVLRGGVGELCLSGPLVGKGYLGQEDLTAEKFPIIQLGGLSRCGIEEKVRIYRTGDLVRILPSGHLDFVGRKDDQIKLRGQRLELTEIEHVIKRNPEIADAVVLVAKTEGKEGRDVLVSFIASSTDNTPGHIPKDRGIRGSAANRQYFNSKKEGQGGRKVEILWDDGRSCIGNAIRTADMVKSVIRSCKDKLPRYMVPTYVLRVRAIPLSSNNKAEVKLLKQFFESLKVKELLALSSSQTAGTHPKKITTETPSSLYEEKIMPNFAATEVESSAISEGTIVSEGDVIEKLRIIISVLQNLGYLLPKARNLTKNSNNMAENESSDLLILSQTSIFSLGIDSISTLRLCKGLRAAGFDTKTTTPARILQYPVLYEMAEILALSSSTSSNILPASISLPTTSSSPITNSNLMEIKFNADKTLIQIAASAFKISPESIEYAAPCTPLQEGIVTRFRAAMAIGQDYPQTKRNHFPYHHTFTFRLPSSVDVLRLRTAWERAVSLLPILRTRFLCLSSNLVHEKTDRGNYLQVALKDDPSRAWWRGEFFLPCIDKTERDSILEGLCSSLLSSWAQRNNANPGHIVDTINLTLFTTVYGKTQEKTLVLHLFHAIYDGTSLDLLLKFVAAQYEASTFLEVEGPLFADILHHGPLKSSAATKEFWISHFKGVCTAKIPQLSRNPHSTPVAARKTVSFSLVADTGKILAVSHQAIVQAAWAFVLRCILPEDVDVTMGLVLSGRSTLDFDGAENVIGPLFNTLPFRCVMRIGLQDSWADIIRRCHTFNANTFSMQHVSLRDVQKWCNRGKALFDSLFTFQRDQISDRGYAQLWSEMDNMISEEEPDYPLSLEATATFDGQLRLLVLAQKDFADKFSLQKILNIFESALTSLSCPDASISDAYKTLSAEFSTCTPIQGVPAEMPIKQWETKNIIASQKQNENYIWSPVARILQEEIAHLAQVPVGRVTAQISILDLGLDSIDIIKLVARLKERSIFGISYGKILRAMSIDKMIEFLSVPVDGGCYRDYVNTPTQLIAATKAVEPNETNIIFKINHLSACISSHLMENGKDLQDIETVLPPTPLQDAMVANMLNSGFVHYFNQDVLELRDDVDKKRLEAAIQQVIDASPVLRTVFLQVGANWRENIAKNADQILDPELEDLGKYDFTFAQAILKKQVWSIGHFSLSSMTEIGSVCQIARERARVCQGEGGLLQFSMVTVRQYVDNDIKEKRFLILSIAHALYDGWSLALLHSDIRAAYAGCFAPRPDYGRYLLRILTSSENEEGLEFWRQYLQEAKPTKLKPRGKSKNEKHKSTNASTKATPHRVERNSAFSVYSIKRLCKRYNVLTTQAICQATFAAVLSVITGSLDVIFGTVLAGREDDGAEEVALPMMNTVPVRIQIQGSVSEYLSSIGKSGTKMLKYGDISLKKAQKTAGIRGTLFDTLFIMQMGVNKKYKDESKEKETDLMKSVDGEAEVEYPLCVEAEMVGENLVWRVACQDTYFDAEETQKVTEMLDDVLSFFLTAENPEVRQVLSSKDGKLRVCELNAFEMLDEKSKSTYGTSKSEEAIKIVEKSYCPARAAFAELDNELVMSVLSALSRVSGVPIDAITQKHTIYHLGLDSINAIKVVSLLRKQNITLQVKDMIDTDVYKMISRAKLKAQIATKQRTISLPQQHKMIFNSDMVIPTQEELKRYGETEILDLATAIPATSFQVHMLISWLNSSGKILFPEFKFLIKGHGISVQSVAWTWKKLFEEIPLLQSTFLANDERQVPFSLVQICGGVQVKTVQTPSVSKIEERRSLQPREYLIVAPAVKDDTLVTAMAEVQVRDKQIDKPREVVATLRISHALYDANTLASILERLGELLNESSAAAEGELQDGAKDYFNYSTTNFSSDIKLFHNNLRLLNLRKEFWKEYLLGAKTFCFSGAGDEEGSTLSSRNREAFFWPAALTRESVKNLRLQCQRKGISLQALSFAVYAAILAIRRKTAPKITKEDMDVVIGVYFSNFARSDEDEGENSLGLQKLKKKNSYNPTLRLLPLRVRFHTLFTPTAARAKKMEELFNAAERVQNDIHAITQQGRADVGLWEIEEWCGIRIGTFVNFLVTDTAARLKEKEVGNFSGHDEKAVIIKNVTADNEVSTGGDQGVDRGEEGDEWTRRKEERHLVMSLLGEKWRDVYLVSFLTFSYFYT